MLIFMIIYAILKFIQGTRGEGILKGLTILLLVSFFLLWWVSEKLELHEIRHIINQMLAFAIFALIIIFFPFSGFKVKG